MPTFVRMKGDPSKQHREHTGLRHCKRPANIIVSFLFWPFLLGSALGEFPLKEPEQELVKSVPAE